VGNLPVMMKNRLFYWIVLCVVVIETTPVTRAEATAVTAKPLDYSLVITGGELLEGVYPDAHTHFIVRALRSLGCRCVSSVLVDDNREDIQQACRFSTNRAALVIVTGGLGPTPNDITRQTLSEFTGIPLTESPELLDVLGKRFQQSKDQLPPNLRRQTKVPVRGGYLKNSLGTAAGLVFEMGSAAIVALPGPPKELQPMVTDELAPWLRQRFGVRDWGSTLTLRFVGVGQSVIDQTIKDHVVIAPDVIVTSLFDGSRVDFFFALPGNQPEDRARLRRLAEGVGEHLSDSLYAQDATSLEEVVAKLMRAQGDSLVLVEIGSGGSLSVALGGGKSGALRLTGTYVAPNESAMARVLQMASATEAPSVSRQSSLETMVLRASQLTGGKWAVAVGSIEPDPTGGRQVALVIKRPDGQVVRRTVKLPNAGEIVGRTLATQILGQLWKQLR
jgi:nicotinamide-nucleotide amidase